MKRHSVAFIIGGIVAAVANLQGGSSGDDPLSSALDYHQQLASVAAASAAQAAREAELRQVVAEAPTRSVTRSAPTTGALPVLLQKIRSCESGAWRAAYPQCGYDLSLHDYTAYNPSGCEGYGCGGAYQLHARYATVWAERAGYPGMSSSAQTWPASVQDAVALELFYSTVPDGAHWCDWTDYC